MIGMTNATGVAMKAPPSHTTATREHVGENDRDGGEDLRARVVAAAARLIAAGGPDAATTRAVAGAAGVQPPAIYRLFGDKRGLLDAVAEHGLAAWVAAKAGRAPHPDPVRDLRDGWDDYVAFGLSNPGLFAIMNDLGVDYESRGRRPGPASPAVAAGLDVLRGRIRAVARAGRLAVSEARALGLVRAACAGTVLSLLGEEEARRDSGLSEAAREAVVAAITGEVAVGADRGPRGAAAALRASLAETAALTAGERLLLAELLDRVADAG